MKALVVAAISAVLLLASSAVAEAQEIDCTVQGALVIIAIDSPVVVCAFDVTPTNSNSFSLPVTIPVTISPHVLAPAP